MRLEGLISSGGGRLGEWFDDEGVTHLQRLVWGAGDQSLLFEMVAEERESRGIGCRLLVFELFDGVVACRHHCQNGRESHCFAQFW